MKPTKSKLKFVDLKIKPEFANLDEHHPIRDLPSNCIVDALEDRIQKRNHTISKRLQLKK